VPYRVGIDTGGTFTDIVLVDDATGGIETAKIESTPSDPGLAVLRGLREFRKPPESIASIVLGTTITTNAVLQRKGARVLYITTRGFEDIPHLQRADKPDPYDLQWEKPQPLVRRRDCIGIAERIASDGSVVEPLRARELDRLAALVAAWIAEQGLAADGAPRTGKRQADCAIAVNLLFSYANPAHEQQLAALLARRFPALSISLSSEVSPLWREYERASTTILDAFTRPLLQRFLEGLDRRLKSEGYRANLAVMKSNGGRMLASTAAIRPIQILLSGLAGGVIGGRAVGEAAGRRSCITFDMGGTSTDVAVIVDGVLTYTTEYQLEFGLPVSMTSLDVITIGAGGGSIAWVDKGGLLKVGPGSAGADPGPACYGRGGSEPTVTDANLVLGRLGARSLLGGGMSLDRAAALAALGGLGARLGLGAEATARAVIAVANENMANSIRVLTIQRGLDPRDFALVAFGGAGPLHGAEIAGILGIPELIVPPNPGLTSALGTLLATPRVDAQRTYVRRGPRIDARELSGVLAELERSARDDLTAEGHTEEPNARATVSMRYSGQSHEQEVSVTGSPARPGWLMDLFEEFHRQHERSYGYRIDGETIEVTACSVSVSGAGIALPDGGRKRPAKAASPRRKVDFGGAKRVDCPVIDRATLVAGQAVVGPAIVEGYDSAVLVLPGQTGAVQPGGSMLVRGEQAASVARGPREPVTLSIVNNALVNICREMGTAMVRTAYSPIFNESRDFSCAIFDAKGQMLAQGEYCPSQLGAIVYTVQSMIKELGANPLRPGDVLIHNDPYRGGCHMPEHLLLKPIYHRGRLVAYAAIIAHFAEIGGMVVGSFAANATEVFQEGLRLPPVKLMRNGERVSEVWDIMLANHRTPRHTWGDLHAMLGALKTAEERFLALCDAFGPDFIVEVSGALLDYAERWMRSEISNIPDGVYEFEDHMEDDGVTDAPVRLHVKVTVAGDELTADFSGSDPQARGPINATFGVTMSATFNALYQLADKAIPKNGGCYRPVHVIARPGSVVNVQYPGPSVGGNTETQPVMVFLVLGALAPVIPERVSACEGCTSCNFLIGGVHPEAGEYYAHYHFEASGWGGRATKDGNDCQNHIIGNCRITPVEVFETRFPIRVLSYGLRADSGGPGTFRGGLGSYRILRVEAPELRVSMLMDHTKAGPWPFRGGRRGAPASVTVKRAGKRKFESFRNAFGTESASKFADVRLRKGDEVRIESCGGAGYGDPISRSRERIERDVAEGFVSAVAAARVYGTEGRSDATRRLTGIRREPA
jgi:N-methylhydantoinase A/oxoprolinase/acetone carboxylase beta subunit/N-methylhydantoinase B/oxoprolinase/acetone carboxylase alpha subunit